MFTSIHAAVAVGGASVPSMVLDACQDHGEHVALVDDHTGRRITFGRLAHLVDRVAADVVDRGLGRGACVAIWAPNQPAWLWTALGAMGAGCAVTGVSAVATDREVAAQTRATGARAVFVDETLEARAESLRRDGDVDDVVVLPADRRRDVGAASTRPAQGAPSDLAAIRDDDVALLPMSSGTTGLPKAVELTHGSLVTMLRQTAAADPVGPGDVALALPPFAHVMGLVYTGLVPLAQGAAVVTTRSFRPERFVPCLTERRVTHLVVPPMLAGLLATHPAATPEALASVRLIGFGGAPTASALQQAVADRFPSATVGQGYGMTELTCVAAVSTIDDPGPVGSVGRLLPNTELRVVDPVMDVDRPAGEEGELWVRGPQVMARYRDRPDATAGILDVDGWLHTGDLGSIDRDGYVFVVDRLKELIKVKGHQVAPAELEQVLLSHPAVVDAAVTRVVTDDRERPVGFVVIASGSGVDPDGLRAWVAERVAPHKRLHGVHVVSALPRNSNGKVLRRELAATMDRAQEA